jgi:hypothetical protein
MAEMDARERGTPPTTHGASRKWAARHKVLTGTLVGFGLGFPIGAVTCSYPTSESSSCDGYTHSGDLRMVSGVTIGLIGAGIGAGVGALVAAFTR